MAWKSTNKREKNSCLESLTMTKSQRKANARRARDKLKKTEYLCEECKNEVLKMGSTYVCGTCGLTQYNDMLIKKEDSK